MPFASTSIPRGDTSRRAGGRSSCCRPPITTERWAWPSFVRFPTPPSYPWEVAIPDNDWVSGVVLADQVKSLDWRERHAEFVCTLDRELLEEVIEKAFALLSPEEEGENG
jgi:mRNA-degrading endonuclease toxin of MazEF toxin-antitoxin module